MWYAGFRTVFVLVVPSKLSWVCTLEIFVPQNGLIVLNPGSKQLCKAIPSQLQTFKKQFCLRGKNAAVNILRKKITTQNMLKKRQIIGKYVTKMQFCVQKPKFCKHIENLAGTCVPAFRNSAKHEVLCIQELYCFWTFPKCHHADISKIYIEYVFKYLVLQLMYLILSTKCFIFHRVTYCLGPWS